MTLVRELADAVKLLADVVSSTKTIVESVNDGRKYLAATHPEARPGFADLICQMQVTVEGLAEVTKLVSGFRFNVQGAAADFEPTRFNKYVIDQKAEVAKLNGRIRELKGSCEKIRLIRDSLNARTRGHDWASMFGLLGRRSRERSAELASFLSSFYADDQRLIDVITDLLRLSQTALDEVESALGPPGVVYAYNVPAAAAILGVYSAAFKGSNDELASLVDDLNAARIALTADQDDTGGE